MMDDGTFPPIASDKNTCPKIRDVFYLIVNNYTYAIMIIKVKSTTRGQGVFSKHGQL